MLLQPRLVAAIALVFAGVAAVAYDWITHQPTPLAAPEAPVPQPRFTVDRSSMGMYRALSISLDSVHRGPQLQVGDFVDIYAGVGGKSAKLFRPKVQVLEVPGVPGPSGGGNLVLRVETKAVENFAHEADNKQLWFFPRPVAGAKPTKPAPSTVLR